MSKDYDPSNWFWIVGGDESRAFSSAAGEFVPTNSAAYIAWLESGGLPTRIASEAELGEVLAQYSLRPNAANVLDGYKEKQSREITLAVVAKVLFNLANEVRALKGQQPLTANQFRAYVKGLM